MEHQEIAGSPLLREHRSMAAEHLRYICSAVRQEHETETDQREFLDAIPQQLNGLSFSGLDSVAEAVFLTWWQAISYWYTKAPLRAVPQHSACIGGTIYRIDFSIEPSGLFAGSWRPIAVEIDGHAFHERTREQVNYRNARDRALQDAGWLVLHFSFEELVTNPGIVVDEVFTVASRQLLAALPVRVESSRVAPTEPPF